MILEFDANTDDDTWANVFGHLTAGYVICVNGRDMVCKSLWSPSGDSYGLYGHVWDDDTDGPGEEQFGLPWDEIESVLIY